MNVNDIDGSDSAADRSPDPSRAAHFDESRIRSEPGGVYPYLVALVAAVGGFLFGFDLSIVGGGAIFLKEEF